ncbi:MAG TPA: hypothetical protein VL172_07555 [Kofleriaceae bacterium]|nr:hypothetical protein [Kofleriaceae bacterium]
MNDAIAPASVATLTLAVAELDGLATISAYSLSSVNWGRSTAYSSQPK